MTSRAATLLLVSAAAALLVSPGLFEGTPAHHDFVGRYQVVSAGAALPYRLDIRADGTARAASPSVFIAEETEQRGEALTFVGARPLEWQGTWRRKGRGIVVTLRATERWTFTLHWNPTRKQVFTRRGEFVPPLGAGTFLIPDEDEPLWLERVRTTRRDEGAGDQATRLAARLSR